MTLTDYFSPTTLNSLGAGRWGFVCNQDCGLSIKLNEVREEERKMMVNTRWGRRLWWSTKFKLEKETQGMMRKKRKGDTLFSKVGAFFPLSSFHLSGLL